MASDGPEYEYSGSEEEEEEEVTEDEGEPRYSLSGGGSVHCLLGVCTTVTELCCPPPPQLYSERSWRMDLKTRVSPFTD